MSAAPSIGPLAYDTAAALCFLQQFSPSGPWLLTAIDPVTRKVATESYDPRQTREATAWIDARQGKQNLYFSANRPRGRLHKKAEKKDIEEVLALHVDVDPTAGRELREEQERILSMLRAYEPAPSVIVYSGGGYQAYWLLAEPAAVGDDPAPLEAYNRLLEGALGGDHCFNVDRIMRLPGTVNVPDEKKLSKGRERALARVIEEHWDRRYALDDFTAAAPGAGSAPPREAARSRDGREVSPQIADLLARPVEKGERSEHLFRISRALVESGWTDDEIADALLASPAGEKFEGKRNVALADVRRAREKGEGDVRRDSTRRREAPWPLPVGDAAFHGLAGKIVRAIAPNTESDPAAILMQFLAAFGNIVGRRCYYYVDSVRHHPNLFVVAVGESSKARKGTSWKCVRETIAGAVEDDWAQERIMSGLSSGEGLIEVVRDPVFKEKAGENGEDAETVVVDPGVDDKRALIVETEFARPLRAMGRTDNVLSAILRCAWDGDDLRIMTRKNPIRATAPHISLIAHATVDDLRKLLTETDAANGFGNRHLFVCVRRSNVLPFGVEDEVSFRKTLQPLQFELKRVIDAAGDQDPLGDQPAEVRIGFSEEARPAWSDVYRSLSEGKPGMLGAITARAEAQVVRLSLIYALLDKAKEIRLPHLLAALEVWRYCEQSAQFVFGDELGDGTADDIIRMLRSSGRSGLTRTDLNNAFGRHVKGNEIGRALSLLERRGLAIAQSRETGGRRAEIWRLMERPVVNAGQ